MAGIMVSASTGVMNSLLGKLTTLMGEEFARLKNLRKEVKHISDELSSMKDALERLADVDELDIQTKRWRDTVREMSYDIEDIIDDFMLKIGDKNKKSGFVHKTIQRLKTSRARHQIAGQIEEIKKLVHETSERRERYKLHIPTSSDVAIDQRAVAIYANVANLVGMEGPTNELVNWLKDKEKKLKVVSIVGFGGLGKTTLANGVYHKLKGEFHCGGIVPVSQKPNISKLLRGLLFELGCEESIHNYELNVLLNKLRDHLKNKRYFIIIDDLWDVSAWDIIKCVFPENDLGSRVIVTTRIKNVAEACCSHHTEYILKMKPLSEEDSRKLFFDRIFGSQDACPGHLKDISIEILRKCGGLPLAIISISSILASENSNQKEMWEHVQTSLGSMSSTNLTLEGMRQILKLSYKNLPHHLKTCFLYLGMYPEDQTIYSFHLEGRWIAEGFISKAHGRSAEQIARSYFNELVNRSLVQPVDIDEYGVFSCKVHDMMLDLILCMSAEENFITVVDNPEAITGLLQKSRRMLFYSHGAILPGDISMSQVRSLAIFRGSKHIPSLTEFKFLRVFFAEFPASSADANEKIDLTELSKLYQLRYLFIEGCHRCQLPTQIKGLQHLESFNIDDGSSIPSDIFQLPCLKRLAIQQAVRLPEGIGKMISLQVLFKFDMLNNSLDSINGLGELTNLNYLDLSSEASQDEMGTHMDVLSSSLRKLSRLEELSIRCRNSRILEQLTLSPPPCLLEKLVMEMSSRVPNWFSELHNLCYLTLTVVKLDKDGVGILAELPVLTDLNLVLKTAPEEIVVIYGTAFAVLKGFRMCCTESYSWLTFKAGAMPKLQRLSLDLNAKGRQNEAAPTGIEHLLALENINVAIFGGGATQSEERSVESAFRTAINMHPGHPRVKIQCGDRIGCAD